MSKQVNRLAIHPVKAVFQLDRICILPEGIMAHGLQRMAISPSLWTAGLLPVREWNITVNSPEMEKASKLQRCVRKITRSTGEKVFVDLGRISAAQLHSRLSLTDPKSNNGGQQRGSLYAPGRRDRNREPDSGRIYPPDAKQRDAVKVD